MQMSAETDSYAGTAGLDVRSGVKHTDETPIHPVLLGIKGSPRRNGNTDRLLDVALAAARDAGAETNVVIAAEAGLLPCSGCNACVKTGVCVLRDEGPALYTMLDSADAIIIASPVYFATVPAVLKVIIDRLQPYWARRYVLGMKRSFRRSGGILIARAGGDPYGFEPTEATLRSAFAILETDVSAVYCAEELDLPDDLDRNTLPLTHAADLGTAVAKEARQRLGGDSQPPFMS